MTRRAAAPPRLARAAAADRARRCRAHAAAVVAASFRRVARVRRRGATPSRARLEGPRAGVSARRARECAGARRDRGRRPPLRAARASSPARRPRASLRRDAPPRSAAASVGDAAGRCGPPRDDAKDGGRLSVGARARCRARTPPPKPAKCGALAALASQRQGSSRAPSARVLARAASAIVAEPAPRPSAARRLALDPIRRRARARGPISASLAAPPASTPDGAARARHVRRHGARRAPR